MMAAKIGYSARVAIVLDSKGKYKCVLFNCVYKIYCTTGMFGGENTELANLVNKDFAFCKPDNNSNKSVFLLWCIC